MGFFDTAFSYFLFSCSPCFISLTFIFFRLNLNFCVFKTKSSFQFLQPVFTAFRILITSPLKALTTVKFQKDFRPKKPVFQRISSKTMINTKWLHVGLWLIIPTLITKQPDIVGPNTCNLSHPPQGKHYMRVCTTLRDPHYDEAVGTGESVKPYFTSVTRRNTLNLCRRFTASPHFLNLCRATVTIDKSPCTRNNECLPDSFKLILVKSPVLFELPYLF